MLQARPSAAQCHGSQQLPHGGLSCVQDSAASVQCTHWPPVYCCACRLARAPPSNAARACRVQAKQQEVQELKGLLSKV